MKKMVSVLLVIVLVFALVGCSNTKKDETKADASDDQAKQDQEKQPDSKDEAKQGEEQKQEDSQAKDGDQSKGDKEPEEPAVNAFVGKNSDTMLGNIKLESIWIPFEKPAQVENTFKSYAVKAGDKYYVILDSKLKEYEQKDGKLVFVKEIALPSDYSRLSKDDNGILYVHDFTKELLGFQNGQQIFQHPDCKDYLVVHHSGAWGVLHNGMGRVQKATFKDAKVEKQPIESLEGLEKLGDVFIGKENIFVTGSVKKEDKDYNLVGVYDFDFKKKFIFGSTEKGFHPDTIGSITGMVETSNGFMALDSNFRKFILWNQEGECLGEVDAKKLFGTNYPWITNMDVQQDGSILFGMTQKLEDDKTMEYLLFQVKGF